MGMLVVGTVVVDRSEGPVDLIEVVLVLAVRFRVLDGEKGKER